MTIIEAVEQVTGVTLEEIRSPKRDADIMEARFILIYLLWLLEEKTEYAIGAIVNRNHSSVHYAIKQICYRGGKGKVSKVMATYINSSMEYTLNEN